MSLPSRMKVASPSYSFVRPLTWKVSSYRQGSFGSWGSPPS